MLGEIEKADIAGFEDVDQAIAADRWIRWHRIRSMETTSLQPGTALGLPVSTAEIVRWQRRKSARLISF